MSDTMIIGLITLFVGLAVFFLLYAILAPVVDRKDRPEWQEELLGDRPDAEVEKGDSLGKYVRPILNNFLPQLPRLRFGEKTDRYMANLLIKSGNPWRITIEEFFGLTIALAILGIIIGLALIALGVWPDIIPMPITILFFAGILAVLPYSSYNSKKTARTKAIEKQLPEALDLLTITIKSGMAFEYALETVTPQLPEGIVKQEFQKLVLSLQAGETLTKSLNAMTKGFDSEDLESFVKAVIQTNQLGSDVSETLTQQSDFVRANYEARLDRMIARMETTIFIPISGLMLPAFIIIFIAPTLQQIGSVLG